MRASAWPIVLSLLLLLPAGCDSARERIGELVGAGSGSGDVDVEVQVGFVALDPGSGSPIVVLEESSGSRVLPMLIPLAAARSIATEMKRERLPRPNTHDLANSLVEGLDGRVERVIVNDLRSGTFYALLVVRRDGRRIEVDARPSDAIAIAIRAGAPLFVRESLLEETGEDDELERGRTVERRA